MDKKGGLSAVIIAKDEERLIDGCLRSLEFCDEIIVVVDESSKDDTEKIARRHTKKVFTRKLEDFASQKNYGIEQASFGWVLIVDADERVAPQLRAEIQSAIASPDLTAYEIPTKPYLFGVEVKHSGWAPSYHTRLFRADKRYVGVVHEVIELDREPLRLRHPIVHYNYVDIHHFLRKLNHYTDLEAVKLHQSGQGFKPRYVITHPAREVAFRYLKCQGYRDGFIGIVLAALMGCYRLASTLKWWELERAQNVYEVYERIDKEILGE